MSIAVAVNLLLVLHAVVAASHGSSLISEQPTTYSFSEHYSYPYHYVTYYAHHKKYIYTYETCSSPPSSIEVCLSSVFSSIEHALSSIGSSLKSHEATMKVQMHHEHTMLYSEVSYVSEVQDIAKQVKEAVGANYNALYDEVEQLQLEKQNIEEAYAALHEQLSAVEAEVQAILNDRQSMYKQYEAIQVAKWSVYDAVSAIESEKAAVQEQEAVVEEVISEMNAQMQKIAGKVGQLNKRQNWLASWEVKLCSDLSDFYADIKHFKSAEIDLESHQVALYKEQKRLMSEAQQVEEALEKLHEEYRAIASQLVYLEAYDEQIQQMKHYIDSEASVFISAYEEFTCEDSLLYYEACKSTAAPVAAPAAPARVAAAATSARTVAITSSAKAKAPKTSTSKSVKP